MKLLFYINIAAFVFTLATFIIGIFETDYLYWALIFHFFLGITNLVSALIIKIFFNLSSKLSKAQYFNYWIYTILSLLILVIISIILSRISISTVISHVVLIIFFIIIPLSVALYFLRTLYLIKTSNP